ncbi:MAG: NUDIX hydrolase [Phycisphaerales bacterium]
MNESRSFRVQDLPASSRVILAAGGVLWESEAKQRLCIIHRPRYDDWSLPKGKWEPGETLEECAIREIDEETRCQVMLGAFIDVVRYGVKGSMKFVFFWHMTTVGRSRFEPNEEVDRLEWVTPGEAMTRLTHAHEKTLLSGAL